LELIRGHAVFKCFVELEFFYLLTSSIETHTRDESLFLKMAIVYFFLAQYFAVATAAKYCSLTLLQVRRKINVMLT